MGAGGVAAGAHVCGLENEHGTFVAGEHACKAERVGSRETSPALIQLWGKVERAREARWETHSTKLAARLRRRAFLVARALPVLPGRTVLELGAGSGIWTEHLAAVLDGQNPITAAVFDEDLAHNAQSKDLPNTMFTHVMDLEAVLSPESFDYVVGADILTRELCSAILETAYRCLKPGGQFVFFVRNASNPLTYLRELPAKITKRNRDVDVGHHVTSEACVAAAAHNGFESIEVTTSEVIPPLQSSAGQAIGLILERAPLLRRFSTVISIRGTKPSGVSSEDAVQASLATHHQLFGAVSVVVPCHNEEANIKRLITTLLGMYGDYLYEIVIVDDNSTDRTAEVAAAVASNEPRVKLVKREPPGGVGRALRDGYAAASGEYILSIDCDFVTIASEFRGLFDAVAEGYDGAIGSRFSSESALVRYPFFKILCNRGYHLLLNVLLGKRVRDVSNNLKLYRAEILKRLDIEEGHFAANVETGLKPLLLNYRIREVPVSWINRTGDMGQSSFNLLKAGPNYLGVLLRTAWRFWRGGYRDSR